MKISKTGLDLIEEFEGGPYLNAYRDPIGIWTIGYGHTKGVYAGQRITKAQAEEFLKEDAGDAEAAVNKYMSKYHFNQNQYDALVSFAFNIGSIDQLTANGTRTIKEISLAIPLYNKAGGGVLPGLVRRRAAEQKLFNSISENTGSNTESNNESNSDSNTGSNNEVINSEEYDMPLIRRGSSGKAVKIWQIIVGATIDGIFGQNTEAATKRFQERNNLEVDGIVGPKTWKAGLESIG